MSECIDVYIPRFVPGKNIGLTEFVEVWGFPNYEINSQGTLRHKTTKLIKTPIRDVKPRSRQVYLSVDLWEDNKPYRTGVHRLLAATFKAHPINTSDYLINHKDGNGLNNALDNLEWCDYSRNINHAYETGLRTDNVPILLKNVATGVVQEFRSVHKAAEFLGLTPPNLHWHHKTKPGHPIRNHYVQRVDDRLPWPTIVPPPIEVRKNLTLRTELASGKVDEFESLRRACSGTGISYAKLVYHLLKHGFVETSGYRFTYK